MGLPVRVEGLGRLSLRSPGAPIGRSTPMLTPLAAVLGNATAGPAFGLPKVRNRRATNASRGSVNDEPLSRRRRNLESRSVAVCYKASLNP